MDVVDLLLDQRLWGAAAVVMLWQFKREMRRAVSVLEAIVSNHEARLGRLEGSPPADKE